MAARVADCRTFHTEAVTRNKAVASFGAIRQDTPDNVSWNHAKYTQFYVGQSQHLDNSASAKDLHCDWRLQSLLQFACVLSPPPPVPVKGHEIEKQQQEVLKEKPTVPNDRVNRLYMHKIRSSEASKYPTCWRYANI